MASQGMITKYKLKDGKTRWEVRFWDKDFTGKNRQVHKSGFVTRADAKEWYDSYIGTGNTNDPSMTFGQLYTAYMRDMETRLKATTLQHKRWTFETHILPYYKDTRLQDIDSHSIVQWQNKLMKAKDPKTGKKYTDTYLYSIHEQMSAIMNHAVKFYGIMVNPCKIAGSIGSSKAEEMHFWSLEQFQTFLEYENKTLYALVFKILYWTGLREGELLALTPRDIPEGECVIHVTKNYVMVDGHGVIQSPKTKGSIRDIEIPQELHDEIWDYIKKVYIGRDERLVLYSKTALNKELHRVAKLADLPEIHVHELRHSHVSLLIHENVDMETISKRVGHDKTSTTMDIYGHMYPDQGKHVAKVLSIRMREEPQGGQEGDPEDGKSD